MQVLPQCADKGKYKALPKSEPLKRHILSLDQPRKGADKKLEKLFIGHPWLCYSEEDEEAYCDICWLFSGKFTRIKLLLINAEIFKTIFRESLYFALNDLYNMYK